MAEQTHYERYKPYYLEKARRRNKRIREENRVRLREYLESHPCVDCGESDWIVLEFDHVDGKEANISDLIKDACSWERILKEIERCEVRCANCHRRKTYKGSYRE